jgi:hypothetical protein
LCEEEKSPGGSPSLHALLISVSYFFRNTKLEFCAIFGLFRFEFNNSLANALE